MCDLSHLVAGKDVSTPGLSYFFLLLLLQALWTAWRST